MKEQKRSNWINAEDSFLAHFCEIVRSDSIDIYWWNDSQNWPKFNFFRIHDMISYNELIKKVNSYRSKFEQNNWDITVKISNELSNKIEWTSRLKKTDSCLIHNVVSSKNLFIRPNVSNIRICRNINDLEIFWTINSSGRARADIFKSPLWPVIKRAFANGTRFYLFNDDGVDVAGCAVDTFQDGINIWGVATLEGKKGKGYMRSLLEGISTEESKNVFSQFNINSISQHFFTKYSNSKELSCESWYQLV